MQDLWTKAGKELTGIPWNVYPRPQMVRQDWLCLNGEWEFLARQQGETDFSFTETIRVPFCPESLLSGIHRCFPEGTEFLYRRCFVLPENWTGKHILLHFGAVDQRCSVWINGEPAGTHVGGYLPFSLDITTLLTERENEILVSVVDDLDHTLPWGKQKRDRGGMWYTPVSGIWQTVWLEPVPEAHIASLQIRTKGNHVTLTAQGIETGSVTFEGCTYPLSCGQAQWSVKAPEFWSPECPKLYNFSLQAGEDRVESYFALRDLETKLVDGLPRLCLNGTPYFFHGLLDQGYRSDGLYTPATPECCSEDILRMKALGFNTLRKHIKVEPEQFYYDCDRLGMVVFQDMVNNGEYKFFRDSVLPNIGILRKPDKSSSPDPKVRQCFLQAMEETVTHLQPHPCICYWTIFNEGWGQFRADEAYDLLKQRDGSRWIDATSGWFHRSRTDIDSLHIYFRKLRGRAKKLPLVISEFGGYSFKLPEHSFNREHTYGYGSYKTREEYCAAVQALYLRQLLPLIPKGLCGAIYTQVSDVEDETNGLLTYDREVCKLQPEEFLKVSEKLKI